MIRLLCPRVRGRGQHPRRGLAATLAALLLFFAMGIIIVFTNRSLIFEQRTSANQYRATKAFEAAEAGLEWTLAQINMRTNIDAACAVDTAGPDAFRERYLTMTLPSAAITASALRPICVMAAGGYECSCPTAGTAVASASPGPAFKVQFDTVPTPGLLRVTVYGCTSAAGDCSPAGSGTPDATARVTALLGALPAVATGPGATITAKGAVSWSGAAAALGVINDVVDSNGITINAGGTIDTAKVKITTIPGSPPGSSIIAGDTSLASMSNDAMFVSFFGKSKAEYQAQAQSSLTYVTCSGNCTNTVSTAINNACDTCRFFWIEGNTDLGQNATFGSPAQPVVLVVNGNITLNGGIKIYGLVYAAAPNCGPPAPVWDNTGGGTAYLQGAAVSECDFQGNGTLDIKYDPGIMDTVTKLPGDFVKIPGSWKDF